MEEVDGDDDNVWNASAVILDIDSGSWADRSPLHDAACQGRLLALRTLILQGHNVNVLTIDHVSPLHEACLGNHVACARALIDAGANVNASTIDGVTPLFNACTVGSVACAEVLLENGAKPQSLIYHPSPIHEATSKVSSPPNSLKKYVLTLHGLHRSENYLALSLTDYRLHAPLLPGHYGCVEALVTWGADVDMVIPHLGTALYTACICQELECARKLLREGANVQKGRSLDSPLHAAAEKDCTAVVKLLLDFGADINARNTEFQRPVDVAPPSSLTEGFLLLYEATPRLLSQLCRQCIRNCVGRDRLHLLSHLPLPIRLKTYLQYQ
ncbi:ankyrin repeat and SOCS box protein 5 isoform 3-T3 [Menidia menidia]